MSRLLFPLLTALAFAALGGSPARAGDLEDCTGAIVQKIEPACNAIINDAAKPADERIKAYVVRSRLFAAGSKFDLALADADAAIQLNPKFVPALLARAFVHE